MLLVIDFQAVLASLFYSFVGILILFISFYTIEKLSPENLYKEVVENNNIAIAVIAAALILAISIIIASAIH